MWKVETTEAYGRWQLALDAASQSTVDATVRLLEERGPMLSRPFADTLKGSRFANMKELRVRAGRRAIRIAFAFDPARTAILLVAGDKRGVNERLFYRRLIAEADSLFAEHLKGR